MILKHCQEVEPFDIMLTNTIYVPLITILITTPMSAVFNILILSGRAPCSKWKDGLFEQVLKLKDFPLFFFFTPPSHLQPKIALQEKK